MKHNHDRLRVTEVEPSSMVLRRHQWVIGQGIDRYLWLWDLFLRHRVGSDCRQDMDSRQGHRHDTPWTLMETQRLRDTATGTEARRSRGRAFSRRMGNVYAHRREARIYWTGIRSDT